jgi:hypothetical protein
MPLTWFAHQVPVFGMKLARPRWFDGVALVFGSMAPDLAYAFTGSFGVDAHKAPAAFTIAAPLAVVMALLFRHLIAGQIPRCFPDLGPFGVRSYGVLATRRPAVLVTLSSAVFGTGSHVVMDWFTHSGRPGVRWLGYDDLEVTVFGYSESLASTLQNVGHTFGSFHWPSPPPGQVVWRRPSPPDQGASSVELAVSDVGLHVPWRHRRIRIGMVGRRRGALRTARGWHLCRHGYRRDVGSPI